MTTETPPAAPAAADPTPKPSFIGEAQRAKTVPLTWPLTFNGKQYEAVVLRRLTQGEVAAFMTKLAAEKEANPTGEALETRIPIVFDADGNALPDAVYASLDDDDAFEINTAASDFLPRRFRATS